ncbi:MAG: hypothetical protein AB1324_03570 [Candidatus Micrarchaeota archaeon]
MPVQAYPFHERATVFCKALLNGRRPLVEVAIAGLMRREELPPELAREYTKRVIKADCEDASLLRDNSTRIAWTRVRARFGNNTLVFERNETVFVYDE